MRYLVTPEFNNKLSSLAPEGLATISAIVKFIENNDKDSIIAGTSNFDIRSLGEEIYAIKYDNHRVYVSFGTDEKGEYLLLLDVALETTTAKPYQDFFTTKNPRSNRLLDPNSNQLIDPRRNMMVDPRRNMMIDPHRNMLIDPRRNMMIDPRRNMMIDPRRNMMIDPRRNMMIDPRRNMMIDPRRNRYYDGPHVYTTNLEQIGFVVRANESVMLIFDMSARFIEFSVKTEQGNMNIFDTDNNWIGFLVPTERKVYLKFNTNNEWIGLIV